MVMRSETSSPTCCESKLHRGVGLPSRPPLAGIINNTYTRKTSVSSLEQQPISTVAIDTNNHPRPPNRRLRQSVSKPSRFSFDRVPAANPDRTQALWTRVQAAKSDMMRSGRGKISAEKGVGAALVEAVEASRQQVALCTNLRQMN